MSRLGFDVHGRAITDECCETCPNKKHCELIGWINRACVKAEKARTPNSAHAAPEDVAYRSGSNQAEDPFPAPPGYSWKLYIYSRGPNDPPGNSRVLTCDGCGEAYRTTEPQRHKPGCPTPLNLKWPSAPAPDPVHPPHYKQHPAGIECIDVIEHFPFNVGTAIKYLWRAGHKPGETVETDLRKAIWYIEREIKRRRT